MTGVQDVLNVLELEGFKHLPKPLTVVGTEFDFEAAARGTESSHDLVIIATDQVPSGRLRRLVAGLARSLDLAGSRRPISVVSIGGVAASDRTELERFARVLPIPSTAPDAEEIREAVAVLLPLNLPSLDLIHGSDPVNEVLTALGPGKISPEHVALINAADGGPGTVREVLRQYVNTGAGWTDEEGVEDA